MKTTDWTLKTYWRDWLIGAVASFVLLPLAGCIFDAEGHEVAALAAGWTYMVFLSLLYSIIWRPWRQKRAAEIAPRYCACGWTLRPGSEDYDAGKCWDCRLKILSEVKQ